MQASTLSMEVDSNSRSAPAPVCAAFAQASCAVPGEIGRRLRREDKKKGKERRRQHVPDGSGAVGRLDWRYRTLKKRAGASRLEPAARALCRLRRPPLNPTLRAPLKQPRSTVVTVSTHTSARGSRNALA